MTEHQSVGAPYGIQGFPTIKIFGGNKQRPQDYQGLYFDICVPVLEAFYSYFLGGAVSIVILFISVLQTVKVCTRNLHHDLNLTYLRPLKLDYFECSSSGWCEVHQERLGCDF